VVSAGAAWVRGTAAIRASSNAERIIDKAPAGVE
jgi:hypothetical protein